MTIREFLNGELSDAELVEILCLLKGRDIRDIVLDDIVAHDADRIADILKDIGYDLVRVGQDVTTSRTRPRSGDVMGLQAIKRMKGSGVDKNDDRTNL